MKTTTNPTAPSAELDSLRLTYRAAAAQAEQPDATAADYTAWLAAQAAYYKAGGTDPVNGYGAALEIAAVRYVGNDPKLAGMEGTAHRSAATIKGMDKFEQVSVRWAHTFGITKEYRWKLKPIRGFSKAFR
jgi:hypothetical protein